MTAPSLNDLELLATLFNQGGWTEVRVEFADTSILLSNDVGAAPAERQELAATPPAAPTAKPPAAPVQTDTGVDPGWTAVTAPNLGTFYRSPKPGSPPFVELGDRVTADTEICLLEVMKLFTSVKASTAGIVRRICAEDAELVEGGRVLFYIESE